MMIPGFVLRKLNLLKAEALGVLSALLLFVFQPFVSMKAFVLSDIPPSGQMAINMLIVLGFAFLIHLIVFLVLKLIIRGNDKLQNGAYTACGLFSNAGFVGIPFVWLLTGDNLAVMYATVFIISFNALLWTLGVYIITGDIKKMKPIKVILNPASLVLFLAIPLYFLPQINFFVKVPMFGEMVNYFAIATLPVSMLLVGVRMADVNLKELFTCLKSYLSSAVKLIVAPLIALLVMLPFVLTGAMKSFDPEHRIAIVMVILFAMPPAASTVAMCERYEGDTETSAKTFVLATLLAIVTLPAVLTLLINVI